MMILRSAPTSPFARKVRIAVSLLGLSDKIAVRDTDLNNPDDSIRAENPLGKVPTLILEDGSSYYDSRVILEVLDHLAGGGRIIPRDPQARFAARRLEVLADGISDASLLVVYESRYRPAEMKVQSWLDRQDDKVKRALDVLESAPPTLTDPPDAGQLALACALGYRDLRFSGAWRKDHPRLVGWLDKFAARVPAFEQTRAKA